MVTADIALEEQRWQALETRDASADGTFVYSVATTGVYCRPGCPSKLALRRNVRFHDTCADAERAGFHACRRCRPNEASRDARLIEVVNAACRTIEAADKPPSLGDLAAVAGLSRFHFLRVFRRIAGVTPGQYAAASKAGKVKAGLRGGSPVTSAIYDAGFGSGSRFYEKAPQLLGMTAGEYRRGGPGLAVSYAIAPCSLGMVLVAATSKGICAVRLGDDAAPLEAELRTEFPLAVLARNGEIDDRLKAVLLHVDRSPAASELALDIQGTAFQQRVWRALREIPSGGTASYAEVAERIGQPAAVRAVGSACAANPVAVVVPCHRVVRSDGGLSGYRWGVDRKRKLLAREGAL